MKKKKNDTLFLTFPIFISKRSVINKLERASRSYQKFKNIIYEIISEYYTHTKDLKQFTNKSFLEKFVKGSDSLPFENDFIKSKKQQLIHIWKNEIGSDTVKSLVELVRREMLSIIGKWKNGQKASLPSPRQLNKLYYFTIQTNKNMLSDKRFLKRGKSENAVVVRLGKSFGAVKIKLPKGFNYKISEIKLKWIKDTAVIAFISYEIPKSKFNNLNKDNWISIDIGVSRLVSVISNVESMRSFLIDGNGLKSFNQWVNKTATKLQSENKTAQFRHLWLYRKNFINMRLNAAANKIILACLKFNIGKIIIPKGLESEYQNKSNKSSKFNQEFRFIPLSKLIEKIKLKAKIFGIEIIEEYESFTSKVSSISGNIEILKNKSVKNLTESDYKKLKFNGKRIKRGLYKDLVINKVFHADLNGALNLAIKALGKIIRNNFLKLKNWLDKLSRPIKVVPEFPVDNFLALIGNKG